MMLVRSGPHILLIPPFGPSTWKILNLLMAPMGTGTIKNKANVFAQAAATKIDLFGSSRPIIGHSGSSIGRKKRKDYF